MTPYYTDDALTLYQGDLAAARHGRRYIGIDLSAEYLDMSLRTRLGQMALLEETS